MLLEENDTSRKSDHLMTENRAKAPDRLFRFATIKCDSGRRVLSRMTFISKTLAMLEVNNGFRVPDQFTLIVEGHLTARSCRVRWRQPKRIGIDFI
jgi:hypothetical protein